MTRPGGAGSSIMAVHLNEAQEYIKDGGSRFIDRLVKRPKPEGGLRSISVNRHVCVDL